MGLAAYGRGLVRRTNFCCSKVVTTGVRWTITSGFFAIFCCVLLSDSGKWAARVALSDSLVALVWTEGTQTLQARVKPAVAEVSVGGSSSSRGGSDGSAGWLLSVLTALFGWMRLRRQHGG